MTTNNQIRPGNRAFEYLLNHYQPLDAKITPLVNVLPVLGDELYGYAQTGAELLPRTVRTNLLARLFTTFTKTSYSNQKDLLALCIFDLQLCIYFDAVFSYCGDKQLASLLADSLLYQATGYEASSPLIPKFGTKALKGRAVSPNICYHASNSRTSVIYRHGSLERKSQQFFTATPKTSQLSSASATFQLLSE